MNTKFSTHHCSRLWQLLYMPYFVPLLGLYHHSNYYNNPGDQRATEIAGINSRLPTGRLLSNSSPAMSMRARQSGSTDIDDLRSYTSNCLSQVDHCRRSGHVLPGSGPHWRPMVYLRAHGSKAQDAAGRHIRGWDIVVAGERLPDCQTCGSVRDWHLLHPIVAQL